jgi:hypothetical protein
MKLNILKKIFMKRKSVYRILAVLVTATIFFAACTKETSNVRLDPKISTSQVLNVKSDSATVVGFIVAAGDGFTEKGVCYDIAPAPTTAKSKVVFTAPSTTATFNVKIGGLAYATKYYARAYGVNSSGTIYGEEVNFTTLPVGPTVTTADISVITGNSAAGGGNVTNAGGAPVTARGVCFGITHNPTVSGSKTTDASGIGAFTSALTSLKGNTLYYVRAYATNSAGTGYGPEKSFTTLVDLPVVTTVAVTEITKVSAKSGGDVTYDGGAAVTEKGLVWSTTANPTIADNKILGGTGTGPFVSDLTLLTVFTSYHIRAYAINSAGEAYGSDIAFTTLADITKFWVVGSYNGWGNNDNALYIISTPTNSEAQGYVYFPAAGEFKLTTDHSWDDAHTFGDNGSGGLTNPGGNIQVAAAGYQLIKANLANMTYSVTLTTWGVIGDATPGGWGAQTNMTYNTTSMIFSLGVHFTTPGAFKFRGTDTWSVNYGATAGSNALVAGGDNIAVTIADDYAITLDLSHPNAYTYTANRWGIIGSATSDGWNSDQNMAWDNVNKVFTATFNLVAGEMKFRANDDWGINFGGTLGALTQDGANIAVTTAGNYTITLDPWARVATMTLN